MGACKSKARKQNLFQKYHDANFQTIQNHQAHLVKARFNPSNPKGLTLQEFGMFFPRLLPQPQSVRRRIFENFSTFLLLPYKSLCESLFLIQRLNQEERFQFLFAMYENEGSISRADFKEFLRVNFNCLVLSEEDKSHMGSIEILFDFLMPTKEAKISYMFFSQFVGNKFNVCRFYECFELELPAHREKELIESFMQWQEVHFLNQEVFVLSFKWWESWRFYVQHSQRPESIISQVSAFESRSSNDLHIVQPAQFESMVEKQATELDVKESPDMYEASYHMIDENDIEEDSQVIVSASSNSHEAMFMQMQHLLEKRMSAPAYELFQAHFCQIYQQLDPEAVVDAEEPPQQHNKRPGQIDNGDIFGEFEGTLRPNLQINHDYVILPRDAWLAFVQWYGLVSHTHKIKRPQTRNPKTKLQLVHLYPYYCICVKAAAKIVNESAMNVRVQGTSNFEGLVKELRGKGYLESKREYALYVKNVDTQWARVSNLVMSLAKNATLQPIIFVAFVEKKNAAMFEQQLHKGSSISDIRVCDVFDVMHPVTNEWKQGYVVSLTKQGYMVHQAGESYLIDFLIRFDDAEKHFLPYLSKTQPVLNRVKQLSIRYRGLKNMGNTCFMNSILQCLMYTPYFKEHVLNIQLALEKQKQKGKPLILSQFGQLLQETCSQMSESDASFIVPTKFKKTIDKLLPQFSGFQQHDAQEVPLLTEPKFLSCLLSTLQEELAAVKQTDLISQFFIGRTSNFIQCQECQNELKRDEDFTTLSLPLPPNDTINISIVYVPKCKKGGYIPPLRKYGIQISLRCSLKSLISAFEQQCEQLYSRFELVEIYRSHVHKSFYGIDHLASLKNLGLKNFNELYAYEVAKIGQDIDRDYKESFGQFHTAALILQPGHYIDFYDAETSSWQIGKIREVREQTPLSYFHLSYQNDTMKCKQWMQLAYDQIAACRTRTTSKKQALLLTVVNRLYNDVTQSLERFSYPLILTVPSYVTWKEFHLMVFNQAKRFIDFAYFKKRNLKAQQLQRTFSVNRSTEQNSLKDIYQSVQQKRQRATVIRLQAEPQRRKTVVFLQPDQKEGSAAKDIEFLQSSNFPYRLRLINQQTMRCYQCDRFITYDRSDTQGCQGCEKGLTNKPLAWFLQKNVIPLLCLDWLDTLPFNPLSSQSTQHESYVTTVINARINRKRIGLEECLNLFTQQETMEIDCEKCKSKQSFKTQLKLSHLPNTLIVHLKRFTFDNGSLQKVTTHVEFPMRQLNVRKWATGETVEYNLYAVVNHIGNGHTGHYIAYVRDKNSDDWIGFNDDEVLQVRSENVIQDNGYLFFYQQLS